MKNSTMRVWLLAWAMGFVFGVDFVGADAPTGLVDFAANGSFERAYTVNSEGAEQFAKVGLDTGGVLPEAWTLEARAATVCWEGAGSAGDGQRALQVSSGSVSVISGSFQVLRAAPIILKVAVRGAGPVTVVLHEAFRAGQRIDKEFWRILADTNRQAWQVQEKTFTPTAATRTFRLQMYVAAAGAVDAVQVMAPAGVLGPMPTVGVRPDRDADTLLLLDFDQPLPADAALIGSTEKVPGRFGQAVKFGTGSALKVPIEGRVRREEGTLEFWLQFADDNVKQRRRVISFGNNTGYHVGTDPYDRMIFSANEGWKGIGAILTGMGKWGSNSWRHVAVTWSGDVWQLYLDGILVGHGDCAQPAGAASRDDSKLNMRPSGFNGDITLGSKDIVLDEIRVSSRPRYGWPSRPAAALAATPAVAASVKPPPKPAVAATNVWQPTFRRGDLSFDATTNQIVARAGSTAGAARFGDSTGIRLPDRQDMLAWPVTEAMAGRYVIGVVASSCDDIFLNGLPIQFDSGTEPYIGAGGRPDLREWLTAGPVTLAVGDQIRINGMAQVARLNLYRAAQCRGIVNVRRADVTPDFYRFEAALQAAAGNRLEGRYAVRNVLGRPDTVTLTAKVVDYEQRVIWEQTDRIVLQPFEQRAFTFQAPRGQTWLYRLRLDVRGEGGREQQWVVACMTDIEEGLRRRLWLSDSQWTAAAQSNNLKRLDYADVRKPALQSVAVPGPWPQAFVKDFEHVAWYRREFTLMPRAGERVVLNVERLSYECEVYVNGRKAGGHFGPYAPFEVELTPFVRGGTNVLEIGVRDLLATLPPSTLGKVETGVQLSWWSLSNWLDAPRVGNHPYIGDIYLETRPAVHADDVRILCTYPDRRVNVKFRVSSRGPARRVQVGHQIFHQGKPVLTIREQVVDLGADGAVELDMAARWDKPVLWQMEDPRLCVVVTTVRDGDRVLDEARTRFGFAHWRFVGHRLLLNDTPQKLRFAFQNDTGRSLEYSSRSRASNSAMSDLDYAKRYGLVNGYRAEPNARKLDYADEMGFATRCQTAAVGNPSASNILNDRYWRSAEQFAADGARGLGNHPCIAFWEPSNEYACFAYYQDLPNGFALSCERLWGVHQAALRERPNMLVESDSDGDLNGPAQSINLHYPLDSHAWTTPLIDGRTFYYPDSAFWHPLDRPPVMGELLPAGDYRFRLDITGRKGKIKWGEKVVGTGETCWSYQYNGPFGLSVIGGDKVYEDEIAAVEAGMHGVGRYPMGAQRDIEMAYTFYWHHYFSWWHRAILPPIAVVPLEYNTRFVSGRRMPRRFNLHNDTETIRRLTAELVWVTGDSEQVLARDTQTLGPAGIARLGVSFKVPRVKALTRGQLAWRVREGKQTHFFDPVAAAMWPEDVQMTPPQGVYAYDPAGTLETAWQALGFKLPTVTGLPPETASGLLVAPGAVSNLAQTVAGDALERRLQAGLKLVVLPQSQLPKNWLPMTPATEGVRCTSVAFARDPGHPVLAGLTSDDLRFWTGDHLVSRMDYVRPQLGNWRAIVDSGSGNGLDRLPILELYVGRGRVVLCQMLAVDKAKDEPAAARVLANLVAYAGLGASVEPASCGVVARPDSALVQTCGRLNARAALNDPAAAPPVSLPDVVLVDLREPLSDAWVTRLKRHVQEGGTVQLCGVRPESQAQAESLCGRPLRVYPLRDPLVPYQPYYRGRVIKRQVESPLLAGISNHELCWIVIAPSGGDFFSTPAWIKADILDYECRPALAADDEASLVYPPALLDFQVGKGRVIVNQLRWMEDAGDVQARADTLAIALLTNLGVALDPPKPRPVMPAAIRREILDLRSHLNRALIDETADDGMGGWTDQGARFDMRNLPTGSLASGGVPFEILTGPKACLVLWNTRRTITPGLAKSVTIPINRRLVGAWFLHSVAWAAAANMENYQFLMDYEDGSSDWLRVITGQHVWDWGTALPHAFRESANRAWTGFTTTCEGFPEVSVYGLEWVNPHPERVVKAIRFETLNPEVVPILLGITLAVPTAVPVSAAGAVAPVAPRAAAMTAAEQQRCQALRDAGKTDELVKELRGLLERAPAKVDARKLLGFVLWTSRKDYDGAEAQYLEALKVSGETSDTLNQLGRLNEERKAYAKARGFYQRSLKAEWNQPPTMEALQRVEAALGR